MRCVRVFFVFIAVAAGQEIDQPQLYTAARISSGAHDGSNYDSVQVPAGSSYTLAEISGAGRIVHLWFTLATGESDYLHTTRLKIYWDGKSTAAVDVPFGDFHGLGHGIVRQFSSSFIEVEARPELNQNLANKNVAGFNSYFPMPYAKGARVVIENTSRQPIRALYFHVDYQKWQRSPSPLRFHAQYRTSPPEPYPGDSAGARSSKNADGSDNHVVLDTTGRGQFIGMVLSVDAAGAGWWEGDESMWIDGETTPSIQGTGTEDYFGGAWGFRREYAMPDHGVSYLEKVPSRPDWQAGKYSLYRFHRRDPIPFTRSIRVSIERGHNNHRRDSTYSSVAYWYCE
jgi:hypothetical protein